MELSIKITKGFEPTQKLNSLLPENLKPLFSGTRQSDYLRVSEQDEREYVEFNFNIDYESDYTNILKIVNENFEIIEVSINGNERNSKDFNQWLNRLEKGERVYIEKPKEKIIDQDKYVIDENGEKWFLYMLETIDSDNGKYDTLTVISEKLLINGKLPEDNNKLNISLMEDFARNGVRTNGKLVFENLNIIESNLFKDDNLDEQLSLFND